MAHHFQPVGVFFRHDGELRVALDAERCIDQLAIDFGGDGRLGEARTDIGGNFGGGDGCWIFAATAVGQGDRWHMLVGDRYGGSSSFTFYIIKSQGGVVI